MKTHQSREDYLEAILVLSQTLPMVRSIDVANYMEFSKPSVSVAVSNLKNALLLTVAPDGGLHLTEAGRALAEQVYERHNLLTKWLVSQASMPRLPQRTPAASSMSSVSPASNACAGI